MHDEGFGNAGNSGGMVKNSGVLSEGLMLIFIGMLIELASPAFGFAGAGSIASGIGTFIGVAGLIVEIIGFAKIRHVNHHYNKAWNYYIGAIACGAGYAIVSIIVFFASLNALLTGGYGVVIAMILISIGFTIALAILDIFRIKELMEGCAEVSAESGDNVLAYKCLFARKFYMIVRGVVLGITVLVLILTMAWYASALGGSYSSVYGLLAAVAAFGVILVIALCVQLAAQILVIVRLYQTYAKCKDGVHTGNTGYQGYDSGPSSSNNMNGPFASSGTPGQPGDAGSAYGTKKGAYQEGQNPDQADTKNKAYGMADNTGAAATGAAAAGAAAGAGSAFASTVERARSKFAADGKPVRGTSGSDKCTDEDPVTMLKRPDVEIEFAPVTVTDEDEEKTILLTGDEPVLTNTATGEEIRISSDTFTLGRSREKVDFRIEDPAVSITHAKITKNGDKHYLEDLNSSNHTYVNGALLEPGEAFKVELKDGDSLKFAEVEFRWNEGTPAPAARQDSKESKEKRNSSFTVRIDKTGEEKVIVSSEITLGRNGGDADVKVGDSNTIGRMHARIRVDEETGKIYLKDEDSANGTFVNGKRLDKGEEIEIKNNDDIILSDVNVKFRA